MDEDRRLIISHNEQHEETNAINVHTDVVTSHRLQGFSDAVFATAATLLVVPIRRFEKEDKETLKDALLANWLQFIVFIFGYLVICTIWESQIIRMKLLNKVDDVIVVLTLLSLMVTTFLPFTIELEGKFAEKKSPIILNAVLLIILEILELIMFVYGFHTPNLLTGEFNRLPPEVKSVKKKQIYMKIFINCALFILAALFCSVSYIASAILICFVIVTPLLRRLMVRFTNYCTRCYGDHIPSDFEVLTGRMNKERVEMFSDAAMAIIATLLILDLTTEGFPSRKKVEDFGLIDTLLGMWQEFVAYMATFVVVGMQWFVHHSVIQKIETFTPLMVLLNNMFLAFTAFSPFISTLVNKYTGHITHDEKIAVLFSSIFIFISSLMILLILLCAIYQENVAFYQWAVIETHQVGNKSRIYLLLKTMIIPCIAFLVFMLGLISKYSAFLAYHFALICVPFFFVLLKYIFACHCMQENLDTPADDSSISGEATNNTFDPYLDSMHVETGGVNSP